MVSLLTGVVTGMVSLLTGVVTGMVSLLTGVTGMVSLLTGVVTGMVSLLTGGRGGGDGDGVAVDVGGDGDGVTVDGGGVTIDGGGVAADGGSVAADGGSVAVSRDDVCVGGVSRRGVGVDGGGVGTAWVVEGVDAVVRSIFYGVEVVNIDTVIDSRCSNANGELTLYRRHPQLVDGADGESVSLELLVHSLAARPALQHDGACCVIQGQRQQFAFASADLDDGHQ